LTGSLRLEPLGDGLPVVALVPAELEVRDAPGPGLLSDPACGDAEALGNLVGFKETAGHGAASSSVGMLS
jgi:hypothetical protein